MHCTTQDSMSYGVFRDWVLNETLGLPTNKLWASIWGKGFRNRCLLNAFKCNAESVEVIICLSKTFLQIFYLLRSRNRSFYKRPMHLYCVWTLLNAKGGYFTCNYMGHLQTLLFRLHSKLKNPWAFWCVQKGARLYIVFVHTVVMIDIFAT